MNTRNLPAAVAAALIIVFGGVLAWRHYRVPAGANGNVNAAQNATASNGNANANSGAAEKNVYFGNQTLAKGSFDCSLMFPIKRSGQTPRELLEALLAGPTAAEQGRGYASFFSKDTKNLLLGFRIVDKTAYVNFKAEIKQLIPNASTSCGGAEILAEVGTTLKQFPEVTRALYAIGGDSRAFYEWLQFGCDAGNDFCDDANFTP